MYSRRIEGAIWEHGVGVPLFPHGLPLWFCVVRCADFILSCCKVRDGVFAYEVNGTSGQICPYIPRE